MAECSNCDTGAGPFAEGRELVEFVSKVHDGALKDQPISGGGLDTKCQGCGERFILKTFVGKCPECEGVHAVSPPRCDDAANIQFAGVGYRLEQ
ncbi:MAG: hypothetical protein JRI73_04360 [Deltaproteobacteria bacterium]|nr:hypothetical protein [Deltaproteobacteria bacterium]